MNLNLGKTVKSVVQLISANMVVKILGFFMVALYTRYLTKEELALIPVHAMLGSLGMVFFGFGIRPSLLKMLPAKLREAPSEARGLMFTGSAILFAGTLVFSVGLFFLAGEAARILFKDQAFEPLLKIVAVGTFLTGARDITNYMLWANSRFDKISVIQITSAVTRAALGATLVINFGIKGLAIALVVNDLACFILSLFFLRDFLGQKDIQWFSPWQLLKVSIPFYLESFLVYFRGKGDQWIVATALGPAAMGTYFIAKRIPQLLVILRGSIDNVMTPELSRRINQPAEMVNYLSKIKRTIYYGMIPVFMVVIGLNPLIITTMAGHSYGDAIIPSIVLCLWQLVQLMQTPASRGVFVMRPPRVRATLTLIESITLLAALAIAAPRWEVHGVVGSLLLASIVAWSIAEILLRKAIGSTAMWGDFLKSVIPGIIVAGFILAMQQWNDGLLMTGSYAVIGIMFFVITQSTINSKSFYGALDDITPFKVTDPLRRLIRQ